MLKNESAIDVWHDRKILAGDAFDSAVEAKLATDTTREVEEMILGLRPVPFRLSAASKRS